MVKAVAFRYTIFAIFATLCNLGIQRYVLEIAGGSYSFVLALFAGTIAGLLIKYVLDKIWIFKDYGFDVIQDSKKLSIYTVMGLFTTIIFWSTETAFWLIWRTEIMREIGALIGLSAGYIIKYRLDRKYVFNTREAARVA